MKTAAARIRRKRGKLSTSGKPSKRCSRGATMVEFAITATVLFTVLFGIMEMSTAVYDYHLVCTAAREGVRYAIVHSPTSANPASTDQIQTYAKTYATGLDQSQLTVTASFQADSRLPTQKDAKVIVTYNYPLSIPFMTNPTLSLTSTSQMLVSQ
jgi:Flp pilus assembly protein TadG